MNGRNVRPPASLIRTAADRDSRAKENRRFTQGVIVGIDYLSRVARVHVGYYGQTGQAQYLESVPYPAQLNPAIGDTVSLDYPHSNTQSVRITTTSLAGSNSQSSVRVVPHPLLDGETDEDTVATNPAQGMLIAGNNSSPSEWQGVPAPSANGQVPVSDNTQATGIKWSASAPLSVDHNGTLVGTEPTLNIIDGGVFSTSVVDNSSASRIDITVGLANASANTVLAGPSSSGAATPTFRALVAADLPAGTGTVTSVGLSLPADFNVTGSPVTTSGTLTATWANESANKFLAGPSSGSATTPSWRGIVAADLSSAVFGASGASHSVGAVPDPGSTSGTTHFLREDGSWAVPPGSGGGYNPPNSATFSWVNQGTATENQFTTYVKLNVGGVTGDNIKARVESTPGSNFTVIIAIVPGLTGSNFQQCGIVLQDSVSGKLVTLDVISDNTVSNLPSIKVDKFNSPTSYNANTAVVSPQLPLNFYPLWLKIVQDSSHRTFYWGLDGANWNQVTQTANNDFITPDHCGYYGNSNASTAISMIVLSWAATSP